LFIFPLSTLALEEECHLKRCMVPTPTIVKPVAGEKLYASNLEITGLTWKRTISKVYLDGIELKNVIQIDHEDFYASFYVKPNIYLTPGEHFIYTIANSDKEADPYGQSKESAYIYFTIKEPQPILAKDFIPEETEVNSQDIGNQDEVMVEDPIVNELTDIDIVSPISDSAVDVNEGRIEGGVFIEEDLENFINETLTEQNYDSESEIKDGLESSDIVEDLSSNESNNNQANSELQQAATIAEIGDNLANEFKDKQQSDHRKRNKAIGYTLLIIFLIIYLITLIIKKNSIKNEFSKKETSDLPPAPLPKTASKIAEKNLEEPIVEPLKEEEPIDYFEEGTQEFKPEIEPLEAEIPVIQEEQIKDWDLSKGIVINQEMVEDKQDNPPPPPSPYSPYPNPTSETDEINKNN